jgi:TRAP transporter TAXI family solute receptor
MRKKSLWLLLCVATLVLALALAGCGGGGESTTPPAEEDPGEEVSEIQYEKPSTLVIGSASVGGTYYLYGQAWANVASEALGIPVSVEVTDGPNHNLIGIQDKQFRLGMATMGPAYEAWNGLEDWTGGIEHKDVRALFPMYNTYFHWVADADSGIQSLRDMEGKKVGLGPAAGTIGTFGPRFLDLLGITAEVSHGGIGDLVENQGDGMLDANGFAAGIPVSAFTQYEVTKGPENVVFIGIDGEDREAVKKEWPYFANAKIPAGTYSALSEDLETVGVWNIAIAHKTLDVDMVYEMVKAVLENNEAMLNGHASASETLAENFEYMDIIPLHPGAIKYFKEKGYDIPERLIPPEYTE